MRSFVTFAVLVSYLTLGACSESRTLVDGGPGLDAQVADDDGGGVGLDGGLDVDGGPPDAGIPTADAGPPEPCTTPGAVEAVPCGTMCGTVDRFCSASGTWSYGVCEEAGVCRPGTTGPVACGLCGTRTARCTVACEWDGSGTCSGEGVCAPGTTMRTDAGCTDGESRLLTCGSACTFEEGVCEPDECTPGATATVACGMCGAMVRTCDASARWVDGPCTGSGVCMPGTTRPAECGLCGTRTERCTTSCEWDASTACTGEMTCPRPPSVCTSPTNLRTYTGSPTCSAGTCNYVPTDIACTGGCSAGACTGPITLLRTFGGPTGFGSSELAVGDDNSSALIPLGGAFPSGLLFYGVNQTSLFVNNNGNVSFGAALSTFTPMFPGAAQPIIAPWWGDVDTRGGMRPAMNNVVWHADASRIAVTWHMVGYYNSHADRTNSFQLILTPATGAGTAPGDFDVEIRYEDCEWTTGDASGGTGGLGGTPASAGFDSGTGVGSLVFPGSGTAAILDLCTTTNASVPGLWRYRFRGGVPL